MNINPKVHMFFVYQTIDYFKRLVFQFIVIQNTVTNILAYFQHTWPIHVFKRRQTYQRSSHSRQLTFSGLQSLPGKWIIWHLKEQFLLQKSITQHSPVSATLSMFLISTRLLFLVNLGQRKGDGYGLYSAELFKWGKLNQKCSHYQKEMLTLIISSCFLKVSKECFIFQTF